MKRRLGFASGAMLIVLLFAPFFPTAAQFPLAVAELMDSEDGAGLTGFDIFWDNDTPLACDADGVRAGMAAGVGEKTGKFFDGRFSERKTRVSLMRFRPSAMKPASAGRVSISVLREAKATSLRYDSSTGRYLGVCQFCSFELYQDDTGDLPIV